MKATLRQIHDGWNAINILHSLPRIPAKTVYRIEKLFAAMEAEVKAFGKTKDKSFEGAGCKLDGINWTHEEQKVIDGVIAQLEEAMNAEVELNAFQIEGVDAFGSAEVPGNAFSGLLGWAIKED